MSMKSQNLESERMIPERFIELVLDAARESSRKYKRNKKSDYYQGVAQAYTEVLDFIQDYYILEDIEIEEDYKQLAVDLFG